MDLEGPKDKIFVTDFSDLIKHNICPHCRDLIQNSSIMLHIKNCELAGKEKVITTTWFTKKEINEKEKFQNDNDMDIEVKTTWAYRPKTR